MMMMMCYEHWLDILNRTKQNQTVLSGYTASDTTTPGRPGSGRVNFIALTTVLRHEFHHTLFCAKDARSIENYGGQNQATPPS